MKKHINAHGATIVKGSKVNYMKGIYTVKKIYRDRYGVPKLLLCNGAIVNANQFKEIKS